METFHVVLVGIAIPIFTKAMLYVQDKCKHRFSFIVQSKKEITSLLNSGISQESIHFLNAINLKEPDLQDVEYLGSLEQEGIPTIHNMIMGDRVINRLPYTDGIRYTTFLAHRLRSIYKELNPNVILGGHDKVLAAIGSAVAEAENIPWFTFNFTTMPRGYTALHTGMIPKEMVCLRERRDNELTAFAEKMLYDFENKQIKTPAYVSAHNIGMVIRRLPEQLQVAFRIFKATFFRNFNKYLDYDLKFILKEYIRKRINMLRLPHKWFLKESPKTPFFFFGLHMQPESTIDVYAPFYSNQYNIIEKIARSIPPTHTLLVKLHISDADNYSRKQLCSILNLPGVALVSPKVLSREFIEKSSAIITIAGSMGLEGALLGKPVIIFGDIDYAYFPSVTRIDDISNLPSLIKRKLSEQRPSRDLIIDAYKKYLNPYFKVTHNDWTRKHLSQEEMNGFVELFQSLEKYLST